MVNILVTKTFLFFNKFSEICVLKKETNFTSKLQIFPSKSIISHPKNEITFHILTMHGHYHVVPSHSAVSVTGHTIIDSPDMTWLKYQPIYQTDLWE